MPDTEAELLRRWAAGDQKAGAELFTLVFPLLVRFFRNKVSLADCEDLVQKTMMSLVEKHERYRSDSSFRTFVLGMGRIEFLRWLRSRQRKQGREDGYEKLSVMDLGSSPSAVAAKHQEQQVLLSALRRIPIELQIVLEMHYWEEMTAAEIAEVIEVPVGTAKSRIRRAKEQLETEMAKVAASPELLQRTMANLESWAAQLKEQLGELSTVERIPEAPDTEDLAVALMSDRLKARMFGAQPEIRRVGQYALVKQLGAGAQGSVWAAYDEKLDRRVAIKLLDGDEARDKAEARLLREARALAKLSHPHVVSVFEADDYEDGIYVVMEFIRGRTAADWISEDEPPWDKVLDVYKQVGRGLAAAHEAGLVHRDVKPQNILVDAEGHAKLVDFGLVKRDPEKTKPSEATSSVERRLRQSAPSNLTDQGTALGTPLFMAPEQLRKGEATARSDQFALCVALYQGLYRAFPFEGGTAVERMVAIAEGKVISPPDDDGVPAHVRAAILRCLKPKPEDRFDSIRDLLDALDRPEPPAEEAEPRQASRATPAWVWVALGAMLVALAGLVLAR